eukprot:7378459-Prymnesium_polylepis.1
MHRRQPSDTLGVTSRFGRAARLRYVFTIEDVRLSCGSALLQAAGSLPPTIALTWKSGRKQVFGGVTRALGPQDAGAGAIWPRPVSLSCSLTSSKASGQRFEARPSEIQLKIEGAKAARRKLVGTLDLAAHASFERVSARLTVPLSAPPPQCERTNAARRASAAAVHGRACSLNPPHGGDHATGSRACGRPGPTGAPLAVPPRASTPPAARTLTLSRGLTASHAVPCARAATSVAAHAELRVAEAAGARRRRRRHEPQLDGDHRNARLRARRARHRPSRRARAQPTGARRRRQRTCAGGAGAAGRLADAGGPDATRQHAAER